MEKPSTLRDFLTNPPTEKEIDQDAIERAGNVAGTITSLLNDPEGGWPWVYSLAKMVVQREVGWYSRHKDETLQTEGAYDRGIELITKAINEAADKRLKEREE